MNFDISKLLGEGCNVICGGTDEQRKALSLYVKQNYPEYKSGVNPAFSPYRKAGLFKVKNKKSCRKILMSDKTIKAGGEVFLQEHVSRFGMGLYLDRRPAALSTGQKTNISVVYDVLSGARSLLLDEGTLKIYDDFYFDINKWLWETDVFRDNKGKVIWITEMSVEAFIAYLVIYEPGAIQKWNVNVFEYQGNLIVESSYGQEFQGGIKEEVTSIREKLRLAETSGDNYMVQRCALNMLAHPESTDSDKEKVCMILARLYERGKLGKREFKLAANLYKKAIEYGNSSKELSGIIKLYNERNFEDDFNWMWLRMAPDRGNMTDDVFFDYVLGTLRMSFSMRKDLDEIRKSIHQDH